MESNISPPWLDDVTVSDIANLNIDQIRLLNEEVSEAKKMADRRLKKITAGLSEKYRNDHDRERQAKGSPFGLVTVLDNGTSIKFDVPKKVDWDQGELRTAEATVKSWGSDPSQYIKTELKVTESCWKAWPDEIKKVFEPARTEKAGSVKITIEEPI